MANICINWFYCCSDKDSNLTKIKMFLEDKFGIDGLYGDANWIRGSFDSRWVFPETEIISLIRTLEPDPNMIMEFVSFEPGMEYLEAHTVHGGEWNIIS